MTGAYTGDTSEILSAAYINKEGNQEPFTNRIAIELLVAKGWVWGLGFKG